MPAKKAPPNASYSVFPYGKDGRAKPVNMVKATPHKIPASCPTRLSLRSVSPVPSAARQVQAVPMATASSMPEMVNLCDSPEEEHSALSSISDPVVPPFRTAENLIQAVKRHTILFAGVVPLDGAELSPVEAREKELDTIAYQQMNDVSSEQYPGVPNAVLHDFFGQLLSVNPGVTAKEALEKFKNFWTYPSQGRH